MNTEMIKTSFTAAAMAIALISTSVSAEVAPAGSYKIDPGHTNVMFSVSHLGFSNLVGRFNKMEGDISLNPKGNSKVTVNIKTASVDSNHDKRDTHLRGPDFFNVKQYPVMKFVSNKVSYNANGEPVKVSGKLSLHGKTKPVTLAVTPIGAGKDPWGGYRIGYDATTTIKRSDFGMNYMQGGIGDDIQITLNIEAIKQ